MNMNAWVRVTEAVTQEWEAWLKWLASDQSEPEPAISAFGKEILQHVVDPSFAFQAYKKTTIDSVQWRMGNFYHVTPEQLQQGYDEYPNQWSVVGYWYWMDYDVSCLLTTDFPWKPDEALLFMPDVCSDPPECSSMVPATELTDVSLLAGQPPRKFTM